MPELRTMEVKKKDFLLFLNQINEKMDGYLDALKVNSSEEVLKGSPKKAKKFLEELISLQNCTNKLYLAKDEVLNLLNSDHENLNIEQQTGKEIDKKITELKVSNKQNKESKISNKQSTEPKASNKPNNDTAKKPSGNNEVNVLKALIYMGGSAGLGEISEYLNNYFDSNSQNGNGKTKTEEIKNMVEKMKENDLLETDSFEEKFEILQKGIDYLAKYEI